MARVVQINSFDNGSTGRIAVQINETARQAGWETYFFYGRRWGKNKVEGEKFACNIESYIHVLLARLFDCTGLLSILSTKKLIKMLKRVKPEVVHIHNIHGYYINYKLLFRYFKESNVTVIWTLHDCWSITGHCAHFDLVGCHKWISHCMNCPQIREYPKSIGYDRSYHNYDLKRKYFTSITHRMHLVTVSSWLKDLVAQSYLQNIKTKVIRNGVDLDSFCPRSSEQLRNKYNLGNKKILLGVASPWSPRKGFDDFVRLSGMFADPRYLVVLVGNMEKVSQDLPANLLLVGKTESVIELSEWYSIAEIFLNLTYEDNFPTTNIEALACGTPVITYRTGGSPEAVSPETGIVVEKGDLQGVITAIKHIDCVGKDVYAVACRKRAENYFNKSKCFKEYLDLYNAVLTCNHTS